MGSNNKIILERFAFSDEYGTFGRLTLGTLPPLFTVEQRWNHNIPFKSCVPEGDYILIPFWSNRFKITTFALFNEDANVYVEEQKDPKARFACIFHAANWASELAGCIAPGRSYGTITSIKEDWAVKDSGEALKDLMQYLTITAIRRLEIRHIQIHF